MTAVEEMLSKYKPDNQKQYEQAFKEVMQEIVLCGLSRSGFFKEAAFTGGTALRIVHGIDRFSEDLDFSLVKSDDGFSLEKYLPYISNELNALGFDIEFGKVKENTAVKSAFIKADTYKLLLNFSFVDPEIFHINKNEKIKVKMEIDTNPPEGAGYEESIQTLPSPHAIKTLDLPSMFALKCHALMCRNYVKGRDYYDYQWFLSHNIPINGELLQNALLQTEGKVYSFSEIKDRLNNVFSSVDIQDVKEDARKFLENRGTMKTWSNEIFIKSINELRFMDAGQKIDDHETTAGITAERQNAGQGTDRLKLRIALYDDFIKQIEHGLETTAESTITIKIPDWVKPDQMDTAREVFNELRKDSAKIELEEQSKDNIDVEGND